MNSDSTVAAELPVRGDSEARHFSSRALDPSPAFWFSMFGASALGTNLGDFGAEGLLLGLGTSFGILALVSAVLIWGDLRFGRRTEIFFWLAIVILRASATNVGDFLTHSLGFDYLLCALALGAATLVAGRFTSGVSPVAKSPRIDLRYWAAMFVGGVFGTVGGDLVSHTIGLPSAALLLCAVLVAVIWGRSALAPISLFGYWLVVLAERAAGTPMGDWLAEERGLSLGLPVAAACTGAMLLVGLSIRARDVISAR